MCVLKPPTIYFIITPKGKKVRHGAILQDGTFLRDNLLFTKDRMRIFDAYSVHPSVHEMMIRGDVTGLKFIDEFSIYTIDAKKAREKGFFRDFKGGKTFYIPIKHMEVADKPPKAPSGARV